MTPRRRDAGFSFIEVLVSLAVLAVAMGILAGLVVENSKINKAQQMRVSVQSSARTTVSLIGQILRTAGWDPTFSGITPVALDADPLDAIEYIDVFADLNADGDVADFGESVRIRHVDDRIEWRKRPTDPFEVVGIHLTNDADGNGIPELMFVPDATPNPTRVTVTVTAVSPVPEPQTGQFYRYTVSSDFVLRNAI